MWNHNFSIQDLSFVVLVALCIIDCVGHSHRTFLDWFFSKAVAHCCDTRSSCVFQFIRTSAALIAQQKLFYLCCDHLVASCWSHLPLGHSYAQIDCKWGDTRRGLVVIFLISDCAGIVFQLDYVYDHEISQRMVSGSTIKKRIGAGTTSNRIDVFEIPNKSSLSL